MLYLNPDATNTITVTWTERASTGDRYILRLTSIAKNTSTDYTLLKSANLSSYTDRYDKFQSVVQSLKQARIVMKFTIPIARLQQPLRWLKRAWHLYKPQR